MTGENKSFVSFFFLHFDELVQERHNFIANALELHLSCTNPLIYIHKIVF